ncbi:universal stress protein [Methylobacterium sp. Leaf88]|uniref:universal stress protein n=1 Tax=Methylobacterium sp. Leaf88 TaxID=1736244 RepID=UPI0006FBFF6F|nr:universal stress protein [Methylobacterium sp. Leaf88]KQO78267.1 universal stress protein UspA [Methylobacterium sp. Leaf88]
MGYAHILVSVDLDRGSADRVRLAAGLARRFAADLTGVAARPIPGPSAFANMQADGILRAAEERRSRDEAARVRDLFLRHAREGLRTDWRFTEGHPTANLAREARAADLVVVGRHGPADAVPGAMTVLPGPLLMEAGRPVLIVPPGIEHLGADRIVVAWKDTLEARRAVTAALPFLRQADHVYLVSVGQETQFQGIEEVAAHLSRHDVNATTHALFGSRSVEADEILRFARREYADLIVLGAYGHSRLREWIFGGMTHDILQTAPVCCLMSH